MEYTMKIIIEGKPKEIAALELALKNGVNIETIAKELSEKLGSVIHFSK